MEVIAFETKISQGVIEIPSYYQEKLLENQTVKIVILTEDNGISQINEIDYLLNNPIKVDEISPLTRDEIYDK
jgi:hypothetical protein